LATTTGTPTTPLVVFEGGSVPYGVGVADTENFPNQTVALLAPTVYDAVNLARSGGTTLRALTESAPGDVDLLYAASRRMNIIVLFNGSGDLASGQSAADTFAQVDTFCQGRRRVGFKVVVATILPRGDLAAAPQRAYEAARQDYNALLRTNGTRVADALADVAADATLSMASVTANPVYYQSSGTNLTAAGHRIIAGIVAAAIRTL
jgi:lysophospholipase L1-like esterase